MTTNNNWGYQPTDNNWKTPYEIITIFADAISNGGNLLLDIAPKADGTIPSEQVNILQELGKWNKKHGEAVFETIAGLPQGHFYGPTTMSKDSSTIYLFLPAGAKKQVMLKGIQNKINSIQVVGTNTPLSHKVVGKISWSPVPGLIYIEVPENVQDEYVTVLRLKLDGPVKLYRGKGGLTE
jgi:alpha-L-fucosidase